MVEAKLAGVAKLFDADGHAFVADLRLGPVGAQQAIPPRQVEAEIAVGFSRQDRVVNAMHVGRDDEPSQHAIDPAGMRTLLWLNIEVALSSTSKMSTASAGAPRTATTANLIRIDSSDFDRVEAQPGGDVDFEIGMMHPMQPPERRHRMEQHVLEIDGEVEDNDRQHHADPARQARPR